MARAGSGIPHLRIVLVRPRNPLNLLAAARAAVNFGFDDIVVVAPHPPVWREARTKARASKWLSQAKVARSLSSAIQDSNWVLGTSSLARRRVEDMPEVLELSRVAAEARRSKGRTRVALVFGSEKRGLTNDDLALCHRVVRIPTDPAAGSMNLGQAVAVCCYELRGWGLAQSFKEPPPNPAATAGEIARLAERIDLVLQATGTPAGLLRSRRNRLLRTLSRLPLTSRDLTHVLGLLRDISWKLGGAGR